MVLVFFFFLYFILRKVNLPRLSKVQVQVKKVRAGGNLRYFDAWAIQPDIG